MKTIKSNTTARCSHVHPVLTPRELEVLFDTFIEIFEERSSMPKPRPRFSIFDLVVQRFNLKPTRSKITLLQLRCAMKGKKEAFKAHCRARPYQGPMASLSSNGKGARVVGSWLT